MKKKWMLCGVGALLMLAGPVVAQEAQRPEKSEFNPHWFLQIQGGVGHTVGEVGFDQLLSPAAALSAGYRFTPIWGLRFGVSGWQSKGAWVQPETVYSYNYLQGNVDVTLDLANLFGRFNPRRTVNPYLFAGVGLNGAFNNDEANSLNDAGYRLEYIWSGSRAFVAGRLGVGVDFRLSEVVSLGVVVNSNLLSDKYNSKKAGNVDWQFNALAGLTFRFGKCGRKAPAAVPAAVTPVRTAPVEEAPAETPATKPETVEQQPQTVQHVEPERPAEIRQELFFRINSSEIRSSEQPKIDALVDFLKTHPEVRVEVTGYADAATGTAAINQRLSEQRAARVAEALRKAGIAAERIHAEGKGDTVQPFAEVERNRVSICIAR